MSDLYELQLAWELGDTLPGELLDELRWHLGLPHNQEQKQEPAPGDPAEKDPLLAGRGPASRIGGTLGSELARGRRGWSLTTRQEVHAEMLSGLHRLLKRLIAHTAATGPVGHIRFYEDDVPDLLVVHGGEILRQPLRLAGSGYEPFDGLV
ncbi:hypothetical protein AB0K09_31090 [Streptomyces sp. NPDC049577]|uniref:hypothetical protein n=1 Tax=Streptomyces sp. NPDC049577 TaxID=3155153 RepID=UPI00343C0CBD